MTKQNKGRKLFAVSASAALVASAIVPVVASAASMEDFKDKDQIASWALPFVEALVEADVMQGNNGNFDPKGYVTRGQAAVMFTKAFDLEVTGESSFTDVAEGVWYTNAILALADNGIVSGNPDGTFGPKENITRGQAAVMIGKALGLEKVENPDLSAFADASSVPTWAAGWLAAAIDAGIISGNKVGDKLYLNAGKEISRQEFATLFQKTGVEAGLWDAIGAEPGPVIDEELVAALEELEVAIEAIVEEVTVENKEEAQAAVDALNEAIAAVEAFESEDEGVQATIEFAKELAADAQAAIDALDVDVDVEVVSVSAINGTVTVTLAEAVETIEGVTFEVTQTIGEGEATAVEYTEAVLAEDGVTVTLTVPTVEATEEAQSVVYTVNGEAAEAFVVEASVEAPEVTAAKEAVAAYEAATISTYADVAGVEALEAAAQEAIDAVEDAEVKAELQTALDEAVAVNDKVLADAVKAVKDAVTAQSTINLKKALDAFGFEYEAVSTTDFTGLASVATVQDVQAYYLTANFTALINQAVTGSAGSYIVDDLKFYEALEYGVEAGLLSGVNFDKYFSTYVTSVKTASGLTATIIQTEVIDTAAQDTVDNAEAAVIALTAADDTTDITAAEALVAVVDETSVYEDTKADLTVAGVAVEVKGKKVKEALTAIVEDIKAAKLVYTVIEEADTAGTAINQSRLNTALQNAGVERAYEDYIVDYATALDAVSLTDVDALSEIQTIIDTVNDDTATALVVAAEGTPSVETVATAQAAIDRLLADDLEGTVGGRTVVADLQERLDVAEAAIASTDAITAIEALTATSPKATVLAALKKVSDSEAGKDTPAFDYATVSENNWSLILAQLVADNDDAGVTVSATTVQTAVVDAALDAVYALTTTSTKDDVVAALTYLDAASEDFDINTVDAANFVNIAATLDTFTTGKTATEVQEAITDAALAAVVDLHFTSTTDKSTDAEVLAALKALDKATSNVEVVAGTPAGQTANKFEYATVKEDLVTELLTVLADDAGVDTVDKVQALVNGVVETKVLTVLTAINNSTVTASSTATEKAELLTALKDAYLELENVVDANLEAYITDLAEIQTVITDDSATTPAATDATDTVDVDAKLAAINAVVAVNAATTADAVRKELVNFQEAEAATTYLVKSAQVRLEIAEILLADKTAAFANIDALETALTAAITKQTNQLTAVSNLTTASANTDVELALNGLDYAPFEAYTSLSDRLDIAELFLAAHPKTTAADGTVTLTDYTTLKDVKAAIDAAIAAFEAAPAE